METSLNNILLNLLIISTSGLIFLQCINEPSPLSDIPVSDPSVVSVSADLEYFSDQNSSFDTMTAELMDKNGNQFSLLIGGCYFNGMEMHLYEDDRDPFYYLTDNDISVQPCSTYIFSIMLADSVQYSSTINSPPVQNFKLKIPASFIWGEGLSLSWETINSNIAENEAVIFAGGHKIPIDSATLLKGEFTVEGKYFLGLPKPDSVSVDLHFERHGIAPDGFNRFFYRANFTYRAIHVFID